MSKVMKKKAHEWREKAVKATKPGGSSHDNFDALIRDVLSYIHVDGNYNPRRVTVA